MGSSYFYIEIDFHNTSYRMASIKHMVSLLVFEAVAILPVILIIYWAQKYGGGFSWEVKNMHKFNYHPVFMTIAFVFVMGHGKLKSTSQMGLQSFYLIFLKTTYLLSC